MALDAKHRSSIYGKLIPLLGEEDANVLMSEFPSVEADELVTKQFLRAEMAELRGEFAGQRGHFSEQLRRQTVWMTGLVTTATIIISTVNALT